ncbi:LTA synthase family protein [Clostridium magnum]|uniref:Lipoteichoic acid synthase 2 n=1 Tax=Clostridium magnum DSM 2767 TaxID=1121326 RepID=A0A161WHE0_9CLOT|nr:LTA synthase family protein [Clostridium magnum]KZL91105.1 lipoteichoic acid synthase 2 [Clostridium magnum DSM 2767]SHI18243.1 Phosphoglycerol transferase MdoB [Clostridium magnum DSM 2767]
MSIDMIKQSRVTHFLIRNLDIILFAAIIFFKLMLYAKQISPEYLYMGVTHPVFASVLILASFSMLFEHKTRMNFLYTINLIIGLVLISDIMYYKYFKDVTTVAALRNIKLLSGVSSSVTSLIDIKDFIYVIDTIILFPFLKRYKNAKRKYNSTAVNKIVFFLLIFVTGISIDAKSVAAIAKEQPTLLSAMSNRIYLTKMIGNLNFHAVDAYNYISTNVKNSKKLSSERVTEIKSYLDDNNQITGSNLRGEAQGKNLIVIQVEALQQFAINKKVDGKEITPNLNKWINKSLYFDNYFYQVAGGNTSDAEFMSNNSLYPAASGAAYYTYSGNQYNSLASQLKNSDYYTAALHGYSEGFWNRNVMYKSESFDNFYGEHSFNVNEEVGLGLSDKSFLDQSIEKLKTFKEPYYSFLVTLSSHFPYDDSQGYGDFNVGQYENSILGNYLKGIHYTDEQLGMFLDKLDQEGITKNSLIVIYGDHFAIPKENINELYSFENVNNPDDLKWFQYQKVPLIIHFPEDENKGVNHTYGGQMDLYPTLANLFNLPRDYMFGKDLLNSNSNKVLFRSGSFTDGNAFYVSWTNTYYNIKTGNIIPETDELKKKKEEYTRELGYSDDMLNHNLIKSFEGDKSK